ncbi:MAG: PilZ domain-containing protein [Deltaproteobacteria bacterium]|nr:PilZ domain-containing protein [Deltaproteobacteria bacterium]
MASHVHMYVSERVDQSHHVGADRRRAPRYAAHVPVEVRSGGFLIGETIDVSRHALLVPGDGGFKLGAAVALVAQLPDGPMRAMAVPVRQIKDKDGTVRATALVLFGVGTDLRRRWERFVAGVAGLPSAPGMKQRPWEYGMVSARLGGAAIDRIEVATDDDDDDDLFDPEVH